MKKLNGMLFSTLALTLLSGVSVLPKNKEKTVDICSYAYYEQTTKQEKHDVDLQIKAKAAYLMDSATKTKIYSKEENKRLPIASMCKIMTLILALESVERGDFAWEEEICVSERAASMGGSQVFLEANGKYPLSELIKSIVVCSANDSCVAIAEKICGSENLFVEKMNEKAKKLGAENTLFANCTGLPKEPQYSCAKDVALMLNELASHKDYFRFGRIWMDKFSHPEGRFTQISNTNRLVKFYDGCDGGKTGFTNQAGFCLAATAKRDNMRVISVVIGEESSNNRFVDVRTMFDYAFANYHAQPIVKEGEILTESIPVIGGKAEEIKLKAARDSYLFLKRGEKSAHDIQVILEKCIKAPVCQNDKIGELIVYKNNVECDRVPVVAAEDCPSATFIDNWRKVVKNWTIR